MCVCVCVCDENKEGRCLFFFWLFVRSGLVVGPVVRSVFGLCLCLVCRSVSVVLCLVPCGYGCVGVSVCQSVCRSVCDGLSVFGVCGCVWYDASWCILVGGFIGGL